MDLRAFLQSWPFDPDQDARFAQGDDGREIVQVRTPLGVEQHELEGRPDGLRPHGMESALEYQTQRLRRLQAAGEEASFELNPADCAELFAEGTLYYFRYLHLFQLKDWRRTARDTERNLRLFDLVHRYAAREEDRDHLEKWRPYLLRMRAAAHALMALESGRHQQTLEIIRAAIRQIEELNELDDETFRQERDRSLAALNDLAEQVESTRPIPLVEVLERQLQRAIEAQEFERAAELRDRIRTLRIKPKPDQDS